MPPMRQITWSITVLPSVTLTVLSDRLFYIASKKNIAIDDMSLSELKAICPVFEADIYDAISLKTCVNTRNTIGGPGVQAMNQVINTYNTYMEKQVPLRRGNSFE